MYLNYKKIHKKTIAKLKGFLTVFVVYFTNLYYYSNVA